MKTICTVLVLCFWSILTESGIAQAKISIPQQLPQELVADYAGMLSEEQKTELSAKLRAYYDETTNVFIVATIPSIEETGEATLQDWNMKLADTWKPGSMEKSNGLIMTISGKVSPFKVRINPGRGLTGSLTDAYLKRMIEDTMKPVLNTPTNYYNGINIAVDAMATKVGGEFFEKNGELAPAGSGEKTGVIIFLSLVVGIILMVAGVFSLWVSVAMGAIIGGLVGAVSSVGVMLGLIFGVIFALVCGLVGKVASGGIDSGYSRSSSGYRRQSSQSSGEPTSYVPTVWGNNDSSGFSGSDSSSSSIDTGGGFDGGGAGD